MTLCALLDHQIRPIPSSDNLLPSTAVRSSAKNSVKAESLSENVRFYATLGLTEPEIKLNGGRGSFRFFTGASGQIHPCAGSPNVRNNHSPTECLPSSPPVSSSNAKRKPGPNWRSLFMHTILRAFSLAFESAGNNSAARIAMIAISARFT